MLQLAKIFGDSMVLQREKPVPVWGQATPGSRVTVEIQGKTAAADAGADGQWSLTLEPLHTSFEETMTVEGDGETIVFHQVQVGEVWLAGGQSNMELPMCFDLTYEEERAACADDALRFYDVPEISYVGQDQEADYSVYSVWRRSTPEDLARFSATAYHFAKALRRRLEVPVGIIGCNWGGTPACAWMSRDAIVAGGGQVFLDEYDQAVKALDLDEYDRNFRSNPANFHTDLLADPVGNMMFAGATPADVGPVFQRLALKMEFQPPVMGPKYERRPSGLYQSMLLPLVPYALRGVIWYQGETDGDTHPDLYATLFPALIADWRALWGEQLPFLFVQIAPLERWMDCVGEPYAIIRAAQQHTADTVPGTGMAVITDAGMQWDIHPKAKRPVGERLALLARHLAYGEELLCEAPTLVSVCPEEGKLTLTFRHAGSGLHLALTGFYGQLLPTLQLSGVKLFQSGDEVDGSTLTARTEGDKVVLTGAALHQAPTEVQVAQGGWYQINLHNSAGIPARPVRVCSEG